MSEFLDEITDGSARRIAQLQQEKASLQSQLKSAWAESDELRQIVGLLDRLEAANLAPPQWLIPDRPTGHHATACAILSDLHLDEIVRPEEIGGLNAYNRHIAELRLQRWAQKMIELTSTYVAGVDFDGAVVALGGDIFSGNIHEELRETNEDTLFGSLLHWAELLIAALRLIVEHFGQLYVPVVVGNHGRMTRKPRAKLQARDNVDWLLGHLIRMAFAGDSRVQVDVSPSPDLLFPIYKTTHLLTHGDQVKGGGGIGGIWPPIMRMAAKKAQRLNFDVLVMGHWHQLIQTPAMIVNGSLKGYDEYAANMLNARPERAQQALWIVSPERGTTTNMAIHCDNRSEEGW